MVTPFRRSSPCLSCLEGSCSCGAVRFAVASHTPQPYQLCYCSICRKTAGGGGYAINLMGVADTLHVTGRDSLATFQAELDEMDDNGICRMQTSPAERQFCSSCASALVAVRPTLARADPSLRLGDRQRAAGAADPGPPDAPLPAQLGHARDRLRATCASTSFPSSRSRTGTAAAGSGSTDRRAQPSSSVVRILISDSSVRCTGQRPAISTSRARCSASERPGERDPLVDLVDPGVAPGLAVGAVVGVDLGVTQLDPDPLERPALALGIEAHGHRRAGAHRGQQQIVGAEARRHAADALPARRRSGCAGRP